MLLNPGIGVHDSQAIPPTGVVKRTETLKSGQPSGFPALAIWLLRADPG